MGKGRKTVTGDRVEAALGAAGIGQAELARRVGVTPGAINQIVTGLTRRSRLLPDIARELHVTIDWLKGESDDPQQDAPQELLTSQEQRLLEIYRALPKKDQAALKTLLERMSNEVDS
jgi:transcriptional regulator with XRE-family HTH domain